MSWRTLYDAWQPLCTDWTGYREELLFLRDVPRGRRFTSAEFGAVFGGQTTAAILNSAVRHGVLSMEYSPSHAQKRVDGRRFKRTRIFTKL